jgi:ADP-heptose:LPS heptosyltransferase
MFELFRSQGYVRQAFLMEHLAGVRAARRQRYDCVLDTEQWFYGSCVLACLMHRKALVGFDTNERRNLYDHFVHYSQEDYEAQSFLNLLTPLGQRAELSLSDLRMEPTAGPAMIPPGRLIALALGASVPVRLIPEATGRELVRRISDAFDQVVLIGSNSDRQWSARLKDAAANVVDACGTTTLAQTVGLLQKCDCFAGTDSGPLHLAVLAGVPRIVGTFGAERLWEMGTSRTDPGCKAERFAVLALRLRAVLTGPPLSIRIYLHRRPVAAADHGGGT